MTRDKFKAVVKAFSFWKIDKRRGDYRLPSGERIHNYLHHLIWELLIKNELAILSTGDIGDDLGAWILSYSGDNEEYVYTEQEDRVCKLVDEFLGRCMR